MTAVEDSKSAKKTTSEADTAAAACEATEEKDKENDDQNRGHQENEAKTSDLFCFDCKSSLAKSQHIINIAGQSRRWHPECFKCTICREPMDKKQSCHVYKDQIVCRTDYTRLKRANAVRCARCRWTISASDWVRKASNYVYHIACFNCDICLRQLNTGEQFIISAHPSGRSNSNEQRDTTIGDVRLLCRLHFTVDPSSNQVRECNLNQMQRSKETNLSQESGRNGLITTSKSPGQAGRELSTTPPPSAPASTSKPLPPVDNTDESSPLESGHYQLLAHHNEQRSAYHLNHQQHLSQSMATAVTSTSQLLVPTTSSCSPSTFLSSLTIEHPAAEQSMLMTNRLVDYGELSMRQMQTASTKQDEDIQHHQHPYSSPSTSTSTNNTVHDPLLHKQHEHQRCLTTITTVTTTNTTTSLSLSSSSSASSTPTSSSILNTTTYLSPMTPTNSGVSGGIVVGQQASSSLSCKSKRVRTTFTEDQLSILQTHFQIDSNPDGQDLERIATITGLSKRVTQVWFQNSRARQKKYMIKRKPPQLGGTASLVSTTSYNMVATPSSTMVSLPLQTLTGERMFQGTSSIGSTSATATNGTGTSTSSTNNSNTAKASNYHQQRFRLPNYSSREANSFDTEISDKRLQLLQGDPTGSTGYVSKTSNKNDARPAAWQLGSSAGPTEMADDEAVDEENENYDGSQSSDEYHVMVSDEDSLEAPTNN